MKNAIRGLLLLSLVSPQMTLAEDKVQNSKPRVQVKFNFKPVPELIAAQPYTSAETAFEKSKKAFTVDNIFNHYMDDGNLRQIFRSAQWEMINTDQDTYFTHFFYSLNGLLDGLFQNVKKLHEMQLEAFSRQALTNLTRIYPGFDPLYDGILDLSKEAALKIGFTSKAVENIEIYTSNDTGQNAFTVSGNNNRLIIVLHADLIANMNSRQLQAIIYHELGHIRSLHSVKGIMHDILSTLVVASLAPSALRESQGGAVSADGLIRMQDVRCSLEGHTCSHSGTGHSHAHHVKSQAHLPENKVMGEINNGINTLLSQPDQIKNELVKRYIHGLLQVLIAENGSRETIQYFADILKRDILSSAVEAQPKQLVQHLSIAMMAVSRAQEKSCDRYATAHARNEDVASAIAKLIAYIPQNKNPEKTKTAIEMIKRQVEDYKARTAGTDTSREAGSTHPSPALRVVDILNVQSFPEIVFADNFLKLLLIEDLLEVASQQDPGYTSSLTALQSDIISVIQRAGLDKEINRKFDKFIQYAAFNKGILLEKLSQIKKLGSKEIAPIEQALRHEAESASLLTIALRGTLEREYAKKPGQHLKTRIETLIRLQTSKSVEELAEIQKSTQPKIITASVARKILPLPSDRVHATNPVRAQICDELLRRSQK